jgi:hypothetical protein
MSPISITKYQTRCVHCDNHRLDCECKCAMCLHAPMQACHFMCAVPHPTMYKECLSFGYIANLPVAAVTPDDIQQDNTPTSSSTSFVSRTGPMVASHDPWTADDANAHVLVPNAVPQDISFRSAVSFLSEVLCYTQVNMFLKFKQDLHNCVGFRFHRVF